MENTQYENIQNEVRELADRYSADMLRINTLDFDFIFKRGEDTQLHLVKTKAVIRVLGHTTKVAIGEGCEHETYESAFEATKKYWTEYYRQVRANRSDAQKLAETRRQKRYQLKRRQERERFRKQQ